MCPVYFGKRTDLNYNPHRAGFGKIAGKCNNALMRPVCDILESPRLSASLAQGRELLRLQDAAKQALAELELDIPCRVASAENGKLELRTQDAAAATKLKQMLPSFLAAFNRRAQVDMRSAQVRVAPE